MFADFISTGLIVFSLVKMTIDKFNEINIENTKQYEKYSSYENFSAYSV